ncbi:hypothetical protein [Saccharothrix saharensis]|uniref:hypothetical protein n=1 Tax=Saccharothrix saharensis TaxID=571190 RepID=UPI0011514F88|nr:hypothetical protein [Saccharothrix saharensis]
MRFRATAWSSVVMTVAATAALIASSGVANASSATVERPQLQRVLATQAVPEAPVVLRKLISRQGEAASASSPPVITCNAISDYPHNSSHVPGTINVVGRGVCDYPVGSIDVVTGLFRGGTTVVGTGARVQANVASLSAPASAPCVAGSYIGVADVIFTAPPGYYPPAIRLVGQSPSVSISC